MTRVIVCGGRKFRSAAFLYAELDRLHAEYRFTHLMQGGAPGADHLAREWAMAYPDIKRWVCRARWGDLSHPDAVVKLGRYGRYDAMAGSRRNAKMLRWGPDLVVAFQGAEGTADMVKQARAAGVKVIEPDRV